MPGEIEMNGVRISATNPLPVTPGTGVTSDVNVSKQNNVALSSPLAQVTINNTGFARANVGQVVNARQRSADACVTATAAAGSGVTLTLPAPGANLKIFVTKIVVTRFAAALLTAAAVPVTVTTTGIPGTPTLDVPADAAAQGTLDRQVLDFVVAIEASADNAAVTVVCPVVTNGLWRATAWYFIA